MPVAEWLRRRLKWPADAAVVSSASTVAVTSVPPPKITTVLRVPLEIERLETS